MVDVVVGRPIQVIFTCSRFMIRCSTNSLTCRDQFKRPVRPKRCTYISALSGKSICMMCVTSTMSNPCAAKSVDNGTRSSVVGAWEGDKNALSFPSSSILTPSSSSLSSLSCSSSSAAVLSHHLVLLLRRQYYHQYVAFSCGDN